MTRKQFQTHAERLFLRANPTAVITGWTVAPRWLTYPTGLRGWDGRFHAVADGFRPKVVIAEWDAETGMGVR